MNSLLIESSLPEYHASQNNNSGKIHKGVTLSTQHTHDHFPYLRRFRFSELFIVKYYNIRY